MGGFSCSLCKWADELIRHTGHISMDNKTYIEKIPRTFKRKRTIICICVYVESIQECAVDHFMVIEASWSSVTLYGRCYNGVSSSNCNRSL